MIERLIGGFIAGLIIGYLIRHFQDHISDILLDVREKIPDLWYDFWDRDGFVRRHGKIIFPALGLLIIVGGVFIYMAVTAPPANIVRLGETYSRLDNCGNEYSVTITQTHADQQFVAVGVGDCQKIYPLTAQDPEK